MNEEAGFIAALLADPDDRTVLLAYADWLQDRDDPRGEYLRLATADNPNRRRIVQLRRTLDIAWVNTIEYRHIQVGRRVRITNGAFNGSEGVIAQPGADRGHVTVRVMLWGRPVDVDLEMEEVVLTEEQ